MTIAYITHKKCQLHQMGASHPESPARLDAIRQHISPHITELNLQLFNAEVIEKRWLYLAHAPNYIDHIYQNSPTNGVYQLDPDTLMMPATLKAAELSAGAAIQAVDLVMQKQVLSAFCATRPPGHHAERDKAMGFCLFNNITIAALYAQQIYKLERIAIVDYDVHHGNGTEEIVRDKQGIIFCSTFQHPFYPYSQASSSHEHIIKSPLHSGCDSQTFRQTIQADWLPHLLNFKPQLILISAGFDAHQEDPLGQMNLQDEDYYWISQQLKTIATLTAEGRIVSILEGGYYLPALGRSVLSHLRGLKTE